MTVFQSDVSRKSKKDFKALADLRNRNLHDGFPQNSSDMKRHQTLAVRTPRIGVAITMIVTVSTFGALLD
jgi:hypothetical protein